MLKVLVLNASYPQILTIENSFSLIYLEIAHIQGKEWIQMSHSRIKWHIYKHGNAFIASVKSENFFTR